MQLIATLTDEQIGRLQTKTADLLATVGLKVTHPELLRLCRASGAQVDADAGTVRFPPPLLGELLALVPPKFEICAADGSRYTIGGGGQYCTAIVTDPWIVDYETGRPRRPRLADVRRHTIIAQKLPQVIAASLMDYPVAEFDGPASSLHAFETHALHFAKHILVYATDLAWFRRWLEVGELIADGRAFPAPLMSAAVGVLSPLAVTDLNAEFLLLACRLGMPVFPTVCPIAGMSSPYTLAGTLLAGNCELIGLAALTQIVRPGHPFVYAFGPSVGDMRTGHDRYYTFDKVLWKAASVQLARAYHMPVMAECGGSMTWRYDQQNGAEGILFMLAAAAAGADLLSGIGSTMNAVGMSAEMMLIQTAWLEAARFLARGIVMDDDRLGAANIAAAGPGGSFLTDDLTLRFLRREREFFGHELLDYTGGPDAAPSLLERAHERAEALVRDGASPHPEAVQEAIRQYFADQYRSADRS
ncbi:MAG: trimethylamine methyltransferase family protein [Anaerolineae bacterium]|nr:trimethylamine methyltransferase family protein [Anaerolineae bacterium]